MKNVLCMILGITMTVSLVFGIIINSRLEYKVKLNRGKDGTIFTPSTPTPKAKKVTIHVSWLEGLGITKEKNNTWYFLYRVFPPNNKTDEAKK